MRVVTGRQMARLDRLAAEEYGLPGSILMENAGRAVAREAAVLLGGLSRRRVYVVAGKGNNGGDGYAAARFLAAAGARVRVYGLDPGGLSGDAALHYRAAERAGVEVVPVTGEEELAHLRLALSTAELVIDAVLGTGLNGAPQGLAARLVEALCDADRPILAVDIPSGVEAATGRVPGRAPRARHTVTFGLPKLGHFLYPGAEHTGTLVVDDIGLPAPLLEGAGEAEATLLLPRGVARLLPPRPASGHKGSFGRLCVAGGAPGMTGAVALAALAALAAGAGTVTMAVPSGVGLAVDMSFTEATTRSLPQAAGGEVGGAAAAESLLELLQDAEALAVGPGLGRSGEAGAFLRRLLLLVERPLVIDADALALLGRDPAVREEWRQRGDRPPLILTPHPGEMGYLLGTTARRVEADRVAAVRQAARDWDAVVVLKGAHTLVALPDGRLFVNPTGNPAMATGGSGDVLTGIIGGFLAQGLGGPEAALAGVYVHGAAGDLAWARLAGGGPELERVEVPAGPEAISRRLVLRPPPGAAGLLARQIAGAVPAAMACLRGWGDPAGAGA